METHEYVASNHCKPCRARYMQAWKYSLSVPELEQLLERGCEACGSKDDLCVDHDHSCCEGKTSCGECVRGILCGQCNRALAALRDDAERITSLLAYVLTWE